jgi:acylphosphatase
LRFDKKQAFNKLKFSYFYFVYHLSIVFSWQNRHADPTFTAKINLRIMVRHLQLIITGKVENKGFRFYALRGANRFCIKGEVSQQKERIIIEAEGEEDALAEFDKWCRKGPDGIDIETFTIKELDLAGYEDFRIL